MVKLPWVLGHDVGAEVVGETCGGCVEERDGGVGSGRCDPGASVACGVGGQKIDVRADDGLLSAIHAAGELDAGFECRRRGLLESAAGENER